MILALSKRYVLYIEQGGGHEEERTGEENQEGGQRVERGTVPHWAEHVALISRSLLGP